MLAFFVLFVYVGSRRKVSLEDTHPTIRYARIWKKRVIGYTEIEHLCNEGRMLKISTSNERWTAAFRKQDVSALAEYLSGKTALPIVSGVVEKRPPIDYC